MRICIVGVGNIGMRYVQGISGSFPDAQLFLVDRDSRLAELERQQLPNVELVSALRDIPARMDLVVISTSCGPRLSLYKQCLELDPRYVILEKYLFNGRAEFDESLRLARVPTFVNQWMYGSKAFDCLFDHEAQSVDVAGSGWGLACNAVHWIDVLKRCMNIARLEVGDATRVDEVFPGKRAGYEEISGRLVFKDQDSDKTFALIDSNDGSSNTAMDIVVDGKDYVFDYVSVRDGDKVLSRFPYFSSRIGGIVGAILHSGSCDLPVLEESVAQHLLIEDILEQLDHRPRVT